MGSDKCAWYRNGSYVIEHNGSLYQIPAGFDVIHPGSTLGDANGSPVALSDLTPVTGSLDDTHGDGSSLPTLQVGSIDAKISDLVASDASFSDRSMLLVEFDSEGGSSFHPMDATEMGGLSKYDGIDVHQFLQQRRCS